MHVIHYNEVLRLEAGGIVRAVLDLASEQAKAGARVTLVTGDATDAPPAWLSPTEGQPHVVPIDRSLWPLVRPGAIDAALGRLIADADVLHLHAAWDPFHQVLAAAARRAGKPYFVSVHGTLDDWCMASKSLKKSVYLGAFGRRLLEGAAAVHYTTSVEAEQSLRRTPGATPLVEPLVIDADPFRTLIGPDLARREFADAFLDDGAPRLLFLGRLQAIKGLPVLIEAMARLRAAGEAVPHLLIAGPSQEGHDAELARLAESHGLADRVRLLGMVDGDPKRSLYEAADAYVLPSHHENFGIALVEAMMCGAPVLTSRHVGIWREVERLGGLVVEHGVEGFAGGLRRLVAELPERRAAASLNREAVFEWLDPQGVARRYLAAYQAAQAS